MRNLCRTVAVRLALIMAVHKTIITNRVKVQNIITSCIRILDIGSLDRVEEMAANMGVNSKAYQDYTKRIDSAE